jgi:isocitrate lyase
MLWDRMFYFQIFSFNNHFLLILKKWSGAHYADELIKTVTGGVASTAAMGQGVTEDQFKH